MKEILAGLTTFSAMAYIIFVNPHILSEKGMDFQAVMTATILVTALSTLGVALFARHPFVIAPGMGLNAYFAYGMPFSWQTGLAICFISSLILLTINIFGIREALLKAIPLPLRVSLSAGIGLFIASVGLKHAALLTAPTAPPALMTLATLLFVGLFSLLRIPGGLFLAIIINWITSLIFGWTTWQGLISWPGGMSETAFHLDLTLTPAVLTEVVLVTLVILLETTGALLTLEHLLAHPLHRTRTLFWQDSSGTLLGSLLGTSPVTFYLESAAGIAAGGRTGLTALTIAFLFFLSLFFTPLFHSIPHFASAAVLIYIGSLMLKQLNRLHFEAADERLSALLILLIIPLTGNLGLGLSYGIALYVLLKLLTGKRQEIPLPLLCLSLVCLFRIFQ